MKTIKPTIKLFSLALITLCFTAFTFPNDPPIKNTPIDFNQCSIENNTFESGEEVTYKIYYNWNFVWIPAGEVVFKVTDKGKLYKLSAEGRTYSSYEWFFKVRDNYESYIDKKELLPVMSIRDVKEGGYTLYEKQKFNQKENKVSIERGRSKSTIKENKKMDISTCMHDVLSIIYYSRNLEFNNAQEGTEFPVNIFMDKSEYPLNVKYKGKQEKKSIKGLGNFKTIQFSPELIKGNVFEEGTEMNIWVSDDKNKVPLLIESPVSVGSIKVVLKNYKGLKYDLNAKIDD